MDKHLSKWLQGEISNEDLKKNIGSDDAKKFQQIVEEVDSWVPDNSSQLFDPKVVANQPKGKLRSINPWLSYSIAASFVIAIATYLLFFSSSSLVSHSTGVAEVKEIILPDGLSKIFLAPNSEVSWDKNDWSQHQVAEKARLKKNTRLKRKVKLKGKALFAVEKGDPFNVISKVGTVEVLGTTFEVDDFENGMNVICFEGKVKAQTSNGSEVIVNGGDSYLFFDDKWEERISIDESLPSWLKNETKFENAPLTQVIKNLEKLYGITVDTGSANIKRRFTGTIPNDNINVALRIVFDPFDINYERKGNMLYLTD